MTRRRREALRSLTTEERSILEQIARSQSEPASHVARAKMILVVADGATYQKAAAAVGRKSNDAVSKLVRRFNQEGLTALARRHGGGSPVVYGPVERERILAEVRRPPDRAQDGTATWSLSTLQRALRRAPGGLPDVSIDTIWRVLREAGFTWQQSGTWCETGKVKRKRKSGTVEVIDPDAEVKKLDRASLHDGRIPGLGCLVSRSGWALPNSTAAWP